MSSVLCKISSVEIQTIAPSDAARALGSIHTSRKSAASARNIQRALAARRANRKPLAEIPCTCGAGRINDKVAHAGACPMYQAIYYRQRKGLPIE